MYLGKRTGGIFVFFTALAILLPFFFSCGGGGYSDPQTEQPQVLITPDVLNGWITNGYGTDSYGYNKMVILDVASQANYGGAAKGHVPGAFLVENSTTDLYTSRSDGIGGNYSYFDGTTTWTDTNTPSMIATKAQMDAIIQRTGIDASTVVVITGDSMMEIGRLYFNFRYWGFPKKRLRVMNGSNATYVAAGFTLESTVPPAPVPSTYSVCQLTQDTSVRAPLAEMMSVAQDLDPLTVVVDTRNNNEFNGIVNSTGGPFQGKAAGYTKKVAFEGHIKTAVHQEYVNLLQSGSTSNPLYPVDTLRSLLSGIGLSQSTTAYAYCRTSWRAAVTFLALDAGLNWPVKIYDGAWIEWGQMADKARLGALEANSPWRTDNTTYSEAVTYNTTVDVISGANSYATRADLVNVTDMTACGTGGGGGGGTAPGY